MRKKTIYLLTGALIVATGSMALYINSLLPIITGYPAKYLCSAVFISNRDAASVEAVDLNFSFIRFVQNDVSFNEKTVTSHFLWGESKAVFREGLGAVLVRGTDEMTLQNQDFLPVKSGSVNQDTVLWPAGDSIPTAETGIDKAELAGITAKLMQQQSYGGHAFAFLVLHKGVPVAEGYQPGFGAKTRFLGWSMAKSFTNALAACMIADGRLSLEQPAGFSEWQADERKTITINHLLRMQSGLDWNEDYGNRSDVTLMLYDQSDFAGYALNRKLKYPPGTNWYYSSGTTNILSLLMRRTFSSDSAYYAYSYNRLFDKTGMATAIFETDAAGTIAGSSYLYATARDYGRFGLLFLRDGVFQGERILPEGWVSYSTTPTEGSNDSYGAQFWLNRGKMYPDVPEDMFYCNGHDGQRIFILPSKDLVIVVLGYSPKDRAMDFSRLLKDILGTL
jgi:CubicO group peptidase (beta-lactamase class C family)